MPMKKYISAVVAVLALAIFTHPFNAKAEQSGNNNQLTPAEVTELESYVTREKHGREPASWKMVDTQLPYETKWFQSVIVTGGEKITFAYFPAKGDGKAMFSLWWRKNGTTGNNTLWCSGVEPDGKTNGGIDPKHEKEAIFEEELADHRRGYEYADFWQTEMTKRLRAALAYYRGGK